MKRKYCLMMLLLPFIASCQTTNSNDVSIISNDQFSYDDSFPTYSLLEHEYANDEFIDFPTFTNSTSNLTYELSEDNTYYIVSDKQHKLSTPDLVIPSTYNGLPVKKIADEGFAYKTWLTSVYIPKSIEYIGSGAFNGSGLKKLYYDAIEVEDFNARNWVFYKGDANQEIEVYFGPNVLRIPSRMFYPLSTNPNNVPCVKGIYFDKNCKVQSIGDYAFYLLDNEKITLPSSITSIGDYAFYGNDLKEIKLPESLKSIGQYSFAFNKLKDVLFNEQLENISAYAFYHCEELSQVDLSKTKLTSINNYTFYGCKNLKYIAFNELITQIGDYAFFENNNLEILDLPQSIIEIGKYAFANCDGLISIRLNNNLKRLGEYAFFNDLNISKIIINSNIDDLASNNHVFENVGKNSELLVVFKEGVETIPSRMFLSSSLKEENINIHQLILPTSLQKIGENAFFELEMEQIDYLGTVEQFNQIEIAAYNNELVEVVCHG